MMRAVGLSLLVMGVFTFSGCGFVAGDGLGPMIATESGVNRMLNESVQAYNKSYYWGDEAACAKYLADGQYLRLAQELRARKQTQRIVDVSVDMMNFESAEDKADVGVLIKYFESPMYVVKERHQVQKWVFDRFGGGWRLEDWSDEDKAKRTPEGESDISDARADIM